MDQHRTLRMRPETTRAERRKADRRKRFRQHFMASAALAFLAAMLVLFFSQPIEPPLVESTLPDRPEPTEEPVHGLEMAKERALAPVAAEKPSGRAERPADGRTAAGGSGSTGEPPPAIPAAIPSAPPAGGPAELRSGVQNGTPEPDDHVDDDPPPPPVTTSPPVAVDEELTRPPIDPIIDPACWTGWTYDDDRQECVRDDELEPADKAEDGEEGEQEEGQEQPEETASRGDLGGISKGNGSVVERDDDGEH